MAQATNMDQTEQLARIERTQEETRKFAAESHKLAAEQSKLAAETLKLARDTMLAPWQIIATSVAATAGLLVAGATLAKLFW